MYLLLTFTCQCFTLFQTVLLHGAAPAKDGIEDFLDYMVNTWLGDQPLYPRNLWTQYANLDVGSIRTNNHLESFHSDFSKMFRSPHPNIFEFITKLKKRQSQTEKAIADLNAGGAPPPKKRKLREKEIKVERIKNQFENGQRDIENYMTAIEILVKLQNS